MKKIIASCLAALLLLSVSCPALADSEESYLSTAVPEGIRTAADMNLGSTDVREILYSEDGITIEYTGADYLEDTDFVVFTVSVENTTDSKRTIAYDYFAFDGIYLYPHGTCSVEPGETTLFDIAFQPSELYWEYGITTFQTVEFDLFLGRSSNIDTKHYKPIAHVKQTVSDDVPPYTIDKSKVIFSREGISIGYLGMSINNANDNKPSQRFYIQNQGQSNTMSLYRHVFLNGQEVGRNDGFDLVSRVGTTTVFNMNVRDEVLEKYAALGKWDTLYVKETFEVHFPTRVIRGDWSHDIAAELKTLYN